MNRHLYLTLFFSMAFNLLMSCGDKKGSDSGDGPRDRNEDDDTTEAGRLAVGTDVAVELKPGSTVVSFETSALPVDGTAKDGTLILDTSASLNLAESTPKTNMMAVDKDGKAFVPFVSNYDISVNFSAMHPDGKKFYVALDPNRGEDDDEDSSNNGPPSGTSTSELIAKMNCGFLEIDLKTNDIECVKKGYVVLDPPYGHLQREKKPVQFDGEGNMYFLAGDFRRCTGPGMQGEISHDKPASDGERLYMCGGFGQGQIFRKDYDSAKISAITQDTTRVSFFSTLESGEVVYQTRDTTKEIDGFGDPATLAMYYDGQTVNLTGESPVGISFFSNDDANTFIWGDQDAGGIRFGQKLSDDRVTSAFLKTHTLTQAHFGNMIPSAFSVFGADDGHLYGLFEMASASTTDKSYDFHLMQIMPYKATPILTLKSKENFIDWVEQGSTVQVTKGHAYYVEYVDLKDGYGYRDVVRIVRISDGNVTTLLSDSNNRFKFYNWRLNNATLTFSGLNLKKTEVTIGKIDVDKVQSGASSDEFLTLSSVASAEGAQNQVTDMEVLVVKKAVVDNGNSPTAEVTYDSDTALSVSIDYSKPMNRDSISSKVTLKDDQSAAVAFVPLWVGSSQHLIPDLDGIFGMDTTTPLAAGKTYDLGLGSGIKDAFDKPLTGTTDFTISVSP